MNSLPRLYAVSHTSCFRETKDLFSVAEELLAAGVTLLQYRNRAATAARFLSNRGN